MSLLQNYFIELLYSVIQYKMEFGIFLLVSYIFGRVYSSNTVCRIICGWWDFALLLISSLLITYVSYQILSNGIFDNKCGYLLIGAIGLYLISIFLSASKNKSITHVIISILTKLSLLLLIPALTALLLVAFGSGKKDGRYSDGTQNNSRTVAVAGAGVLMVLLIGSLVKTGEEN
jgi:hypothetical protein